jgi:hypothetical protein
MRRLLLVLVLLAGCVIGADRGAAWLAARLVATRVQSTEHLAQRPRVLVHGTPFLPQIVRGRYQAVEVWALDLRPEPLPVAEVDATLTGVRLPLGDVLRRSVSQVDADSVRARVMLRYGDLNTYLAGRNLSVAAAGPSLRVTGTARVLGRDFSAAAVSDVAVRDGQVVVTAHRIETGNSLADTALSAAADARRLDFTVRLGSLPVGLRLTDVRVQPDGLVLTADARAVVVNTG